MTSNIAHLPFNQGNFVATLRSAERRRGLRSTLYATPNPFALEPDIVLSESYFQRMKYFRKIARHKAIVFNYGSSLIDPPLRRHYLLDLPFYAAETRKAMIFQGSDIRISYGPKISQSRDTELQTHSDLPPITNYGVISASEIERKLARASKVDRYIDRIFFFNPDLSQALPKRARFLPYPFDMQWAKAQASVLSPWTPDRPLRIAHISTNRILKGTPLIEKAMRKITAKLPVIFESHVRLERAAAIAAIKCCDILIDQIGLQWYGMQALEAMSLGKPVICAIDEKAWSQYYPDTALEHSGFLCGDDDTLDDVITSLLDNPEVYHRLCRQARDFVARHHDADTVMMTAYGDWFDGRN